MSDETNPQATEASNEDLPGLVHGSADPGAVPNDDSAADRAAAQAPDVSEPYDEALKRGAEIEGEGAIDDRKGRV